MHNLKEKLMEALYEYDDKAMQNANGKISDGEIQKIHVITDTVKNIDKIEMLENGDGYSEASEWRGEYMGNSYGGRNMGGNSSYARGRGRNARRDSMGRYAYGDGGSYRGNSYNYPYYNDGYSREDGKKEMTRKLRSMIGEASSEEEREAIRECIKTIEES